MQKPTFSKVLAVLVAVVMCCLYPATICAAAIQGVSFDSLEFDKSYIFSLSLDTCLGSDGTSVGVADGGIAASAVSSGFDSVGFSFTTDDFDPSVIGRSGAVIELALYIPDINGFLDSAGDFMGGEVTLSVEGIEYEWSLDDVNISRGENVIRLNVRTATSLYPQTDEEETPDDSDDAEENSATICVLGVFLKKLPSKEKASFILKEIAVEIPRVVEQNDGDVALPSDDIGQTEAIVAVIIGVAIVAAILIWTVIVVKKEEQKKRKKRRKKRIESND